MKKIRIFAFIAAAVLSAGMLSGCGGESTGAGKNTDSTVDGSGSVSSEKKTDSVINEISCADILEELLEKVGTTKCDARTVYGDGTYEGYFDYLYEIKPDKAADGAFGYASASYADEITVIMMADAGDAELFMDKLDGRIARRSRDFEGYKPEEVAKLGKAQRAVSGKYVIMAVCDDSAKVIEEFQKIMGEK
ncbi:MAG: DUF4358 domain-containing protein [Butyrivibrio sp.]|nr:DUF4358 domain-containing protein [Butyrivibrio sp.]